MNIASFGQTNPGLVRSNNDDAFLLDDQHQLYAVADGLGGLPRGDLASTLATQLLQTITVQETPPAGVPDFTAIFNQINQEVYKQGQDINRELGIATTLTAIKIVDADAVIAHIGDTGAHLFRHGQCEALTTDHTMAEQMRKSINLESSIDIPEYFTHTLTRCIGQLGKVDVDIYRYPLAPQDKLLLFSDGVSKIVPREELITIANNAESPQMMVNQVIQHAIDHGAPDNITAIALFID